MCKKVTVWSVPIIAIPGFMGELKRCMKVAVDTGDFEMLDSLRYCYEDLEANYKSALPVELEIVEGSDD